MAKINETSKNFLSVINPLDDARETFSTTFKLMASALTLVSALAWNEAIKGVFESLKANWDFKAIGVLAPFVYALLITLITVLLIRRLEIVQERLHAKAEAREKARALVQEKKQKK